MKKILVVSLVIGILFGFWIWDFGFPPSAEAVEHKWEVGQGTGLTTTEFVVKDARVGINAIRLAIDAGGNVGIGTTSPGTHKLLVSGGNVFLTGGRYVLGDSDLVTCRIEIKYVGTVGSIGTIQAEDFAIITGDTNKRIYVKASDGNVGIGTTGPTATLQVNGRIKDKTGFVLPAGTIMAYGGTSTPEGWLICDGISYPQSTYPDLFVAIGTAFGGDSSYFNVPDLRGRFLRGWANGSTNDPDSGSRTFEASGGNYGDKVGSKQDDAFQGHWHSVVGQGSAVLATGTYLAIKTYDITGVVNYNSDDRVRNPYTDGTHQTPRTSFETRPVNVYVNYIIKY